MFYVTVLQGLVFQNPLSSPLGWTKRGTSATPRTPCFYTFPISTALLGMLFNSFMPSYTVVPKIAHSREQREQKPALTLVKLHMIGNCSAPQYREQRPALCLTLPVQLRASRVFWRFACPSEIVCSFLAHGATLQYVVTDTLLFWKGSNRSD